MTFGEATDSSFEAGVSMLCAHFWAAAKRTLTEQRPAPDCVPPSAWQNNVMISLA
jgi:hypothetical protein